MTDTASLAVRGLRVRATELRRQADTLNREADRLEVKLSPVPLLRGRHIAAAALVALQEERAAGPWHRGIHYKRLLESIERRTGQRVRGMDPAATLLANICRDPRIEVAEHGSGRYRLRAPWEEDQPQTTTGG